MAARKNTRNPARKPAVTVEVPAGGETVADTINTAAAELGEDTTAVVAEPTTAETHTDLLWRKAGIIPTRAEDGSLLLHVTKIAKGRPTHDAYCDAEVVDADPLEVNEPVTASHVCVTCQGNAWADSWRRGATAIARAANRAVGYEVAVQETQPADAA